MIINDQSFSDIHHLSPADDHGCFPPYSSKQFFSSVTQYKNVVLSYVGTWLVYTLFPKSWPKHSFVLLLNSSPWNILSLDRWLVCSNQWARWFLVVNVFESKYQSWCWHWQIWRKLHIQSSNSSFTFRIFVELKKYVSKTWHQILSFYSTIGEQVSKLCWSTHARKIQGVTMSPLLLLSLSLANGVT